MAKTPIELANQFADDSPYSPYREQQIRKEMADLRDQMRPFEDERNREIIRKINAGETGDTPYSDEYTKLYNQHKAKYDLLEEIYKGRYQDTANKLGRKRYENFDPYPAGIPIDPNKVQGSPDITGADRLYALYQHAVENNQNPYNFLTDDRIYFPDRTPSVIEFENDKFELGKGSGGDHYRKNKNGEWEHVSTGTQYGEDIFNLLGKENIKNWK